MAHRERGSGRGEKRRDATGIVSERRFAWDVRYKRGAESKATATFTDSLRINMSVRRGSSRETGPRSSITSSPWLPSSSLPLRYVVRPLFPPLLLFVVPLLTIRRYFSRDSYSKAKKYLSNGKPLLRGYVTGKLVSRAPYFRRFPPREFVLHMYR